MYKSFKIITICANTTDEQSEILVMNRAKIMTIAGHLVFTPCFVGSSKDFDDPVRFKRIELSDELFVINRNGMISPSMKEEIEHARKLHVPVRYEEAWDDLGYVGKDQEIDGEELVAPKISQVISTRRSMDIFPRIRGVLHKTIYVRDPQELT